MSMRATDPFLFVCFFEAAQCLNVQSDPPLKRKDGLSISLPVLVPKVKVALQHWGEKERDWRCSVDLNIPLSSEIIILQHYQFKFIFCEQKLEPTLL